MKKENATENQSMEALYNEVLNYVIDEASSPFASKVIEAQRLLKKARGKADYDKAFGLLQEVCGIKKKPAPRPMPTRRYINPYGGVLMNGINMLDNYAMAAEVCDDDLSIRESSQSAYKPKADIGEPKSKKDEDDYSEKDNDGYALAYSLMGFLLQKGELAGKDPNEAIRYLRIAQKFGGKKGEHLEQVAREMMQKIISAEDTAAVADTVKSYVEIRDLHSGYGYKKGERYAIILHHADGSESEMHLVGRNKLVYTLALMTVCGPQGTKLVPKLFISHRESLIQLVDQMRIKTGTKSANDWLTDFVYKEQEGNEFLRRSMKNNDDDIEGCFTYDSLCYSQTKSPINKEIKKKSCSENEYETFELKTTGGNKSYMYISISPEQVVIPDSLKDFVDKLPTPEEVDSFHRPDNMWCRIYGE
ncbi:MAG: hypothetical protein IKX33_02350 [Prevotella sp.]|nr:hypothetical protein [Prevotella sp.]